MPVDQPSDDYLLMASRWQTARDCAEGSHAVKGSGVTYLPPLAGHETGSTTAGSALDYDSYKERALYYNATGRSVDGLIGMVYRRPPLVEDVPPAAEDLVTDVDLLGSSLETFSKALLREVLIPGRVGVLVEHTTDEAAERRPYLRMYTAEDILDVTEEVIGGAVVPVQARLREVFDEPDPADEFGKVLIEQVRVLELVDGIYQQRLFRKQVDAAEFEELVVTVPSVDGALLEEIPFWIFSADEGGRPGKIEPPPLLDLCEVNLAHYRQEADYRNALHHAGVPTLCVSGMDEPPDGPIRVGTAQVFFMPPADSKAYYVSYGAEGAVAIRQSLDDLQQMMAFLGARMMQPQPKGIEAAETAQIHRQGEISVLGAIANGISLKLSKALQMMLRWGLHGTRGEKARIELNSDFIPTQAQPQLLTAMVAAWQAGVISHDSLWQFLQTGELVDPRRTLEDEVKLIDKEKPEKDVESEELSMEQQRIQTEQQRVMLEQQQKANPNAAPGRPAPKGISNAG